MLNLNNTHMKYFVITAMMILGINQAFAQSDIVGDTLGHVPIKGIIPVELADATIDVAMANERAFRKELDGYEFFAIDCGVKGLRQEMITCSSLIIKWKDTGKISLVEAVQFNESFYKANQMIIDFKKKNK
jgi:hypothetical protein